MNTMFPNMNSILMWARTDTFKVLDEDIQYVKSSEDSNFHYFYFDGSKYYLLMTALRDLGEEPKQ